MATWNTRGLRGSTLEDMVNRTNEKYAEAGLALIQKIPTPITPVKMDKESRQITLAFFEQTISVSYRAFRSALMPRNVQWTPFPCKISIPIRWSSCISSRNRGVSPFS